MCLIIASESGNFPDVEVLSYAYDYNPHGWGIAWYDGTVVQVSKGVKLRGMLDACERVNGLPAMLHLRYATHGKRNRANTHPFRLPDGVWMAHNGIIRIPTPNPNRSDTAHFADLLSSAMTLEPSWYGSEGFLPDCEKFIGKSNKLTFLDRTGTIRIANESAGVWIENAWYSNTYSLPLWFGADDPIEDPEDYFESDADLRAYLDTLYRESKHKDIAWDSIQ